MGRVHVETWGCQMNTADTERMLQILKERDFTFVDQAEDADLILLNTCHIREKARHKVLSRLGVLKQIKDRSQDVMIAVAGCVAQAEGSRLMKEAPMIDLLFGPGKIEELPHLLDEYARTKKPLMALGFKKGRGLDEDEVSARLNDFSPSVREAPPTLTGKTEISRFVNIQQGCDNYCTFCVVPFTRGREVSKDPSLIYQECEALVASGAREITLLGQNVNSYGTDLGATFVDLLKKIARIEGLERLRFTTSNPHDFTLELAELFEAEPKLGRYLHLPVQSGSDRILGLMKRKVTSQEYLEKVQWLRKRVPDMALSTDLIVGFPGETEEDFQETLRLVEEVRFSFCFSFKYSPRKNTPAARYLDQIDEATKDERLQRLNKLQDQITVSQQENEIGRVRTVLFHYESRKNPGHYYGRTDQFRLVRTVSPTSIVGNICDVRIVEANKTALIGDLIY